MSTQQDLRRARMQVTHRLVSSGQAIVRSLTIPGGTPGQVLENSAEGKVQWSDGLTRTTGNTNTHAQNIQDSYSNTASLQAHIDQLTQIVQSGFGNPVPTPGRKITITNNSTQTLIVYLTKGYPTPQGPTAIGTLASGGGTMDWAIPEVYGFTGNFQAWPPGKGPAGGATLFEFGLNQIWAGIVRFAWPPFR